MKGIFQKSVVSLTDIKDHSVITREMVGVKKPGTGIPASRLTEVVGRMAARYISKDTLIREEDLVS
jgi:N-acetylneuraminate synthase